MCLFSALSGHTSLVFYSVGYFYVAPPRLELGRPQWTLDFKSKASTNSAMEPKRGEINSPLNYV